MRKILNLLQSLSSSKSQEECAPALIPVEMYLLKITSYALFWRPLQSSHRFRISPGTAGIIAPASGVFLLLKSSDISSNVTHSTPSCLLI